jgi:hypothetical protein
MTAFPKNVRLRKPTFPKKRGTWEMLVVGTGEIPIDFGY